MKNIILFADRLPPLIGGMETHAEYFIKYFSNNNRYRLKSIITKDNNENDCFVEKGYLTIVDIHQLYNILDFTPDIIFFNSGRWIEHLSTIKKQYPNSILMYRTGGNEIIKANLGRKMFLSHEERQEYWAKQINKSIDIVVTNSEYTEIRLKKMGISPKLFLKCVGGVETNIKNTDVQSIDKKVITFFSASRFVPYKNHRQALLAFAQLKNEGINFRLIMAGDGVLLEPMKALTKQLNLDDYVSFKGRINNQEVIKYINKVDYYIQLSNDLKVTIPDGEYIHSECMGRSMLEAISYGTPVIASNSGAIPELITKERGFLVDTSMLANLIQTFKSSISKPINKQLPTDMYSWENYFKKYETKWAK